MGGGLLQLVAHGAQDAYLSGNPQITFWKGLFKRHTNFAMEPFRINLTGVPAWGQKQSVTLGRHADLLYSTYLDVALPATQTVGGSTKQIDWNNEQGRLGYNLLHYVELEIGGQVIDRLYSEYLYLWDTLTSDYNTSYKLYQMVGGGGDSRRADGAPMAVNASDDGTTTGATVYGYRGPTSSASVKATGRAAPGSPIVIPLPFSYTRNPGAALPLIALQYHEVKINILWNKWQFVAANFNGVQPPAPTSAAIYVDYIYLDVDERRRMAQESHEYLIEQVQFNEDKGLAAGSNRIDLTFNHPVKELIWVVQPDRFTNCKIADKDNSTTPTMGSPRPVLQPTTGQQSTAKLTSARIGGGAGLPARLTPFTYTYLDQSSDTPSARLGAAPPDQRSGPPGPSRRRLLQQGAALPAPHRHDETAGIRHDRVSPAGRGSSGRHPRRVRLCDRNPPVPSRHLLLLVCAQARGEPAERHVQLQSH